MRTLSTAFRTRYYSAFALFLLLASNTSAQIGFGGRPIDIESQAPYPSGAVAEFPAVDDIRLMAEDAEQLATGVKGPLRFGVNHDTDLSMENSGTWGSDGDGTSVWRMRLHCPGAKSINLVFGEFVIPEGARVFAWNAAGDVVGAFTQASSGGQRSMGLAPLAGDLITVQYERPVGVQGEAALRITQVTHGYRGAGFDRGLGDSGPCNNNTICPEGDPWRDRIASVAMVVVNGNGWCSGQLINDCARDGTPYFLTANHCVSGQNTANWTFRFNWESPTCQPTAAGPTNNTVSGATLLVNSAGSDVALLELNTAPPANYNVQFTGWDATGQPPTSTTVIHHPSGDVKKISFDHDAPVTGEFGGAQCWHILAWDDGTTEGGSSGSGLWNPQGRLIGQLFGGQAMCSDDVNDYFGRFDLSYPLLTPWLGSCGTPIIDGYDPNAAVASLDASLLTITGVDPNLCNVNDIAPVVNIRNNGTSALTELTISYQVDNGAPASYLWSGNLAVNAITDVQLPDIVVPSGVHTFTTSCSAPNGGTDGNTTNDSATRIFHVASPGEPVTLTIHTDNYGSETTWVLQAAGSTIYSGGPYADVNGGTTETAEFCLEEACFTFIISDAVGDGICCNWGNGDYGITDQQGNVLLDGNGSFGNSATATLCTGEAAIPEADRARISVLPDPSDGHIQVSMPRSLGKQMLCVRDVQGRPVFTQLIGASALTPIDLSHLPSGQYVLEVTGPDFRAVRGLTILH